MKIMCVCADSGKLGDGSTASRTPDADRTSAKGQAAAETEELDVGQY